MIPKNDVNNKLFQAMLALESLEECYAFFEDLCTMKEIESMAQRLKAAKLLIKGKTYEQVITQTDISSATLSRVSRCVHYGTGGYKTIIKRIDE